MHSIVISIQRSDKRGIKSDWYFTIITYGLSCRSISSAQRLSCVEPDIYVSVVAQLGQARLDRALDDLAVKQRRDPLEHLGDVELDIGHFVFGCADDHREHAVDQDVLMDDGGEHRDSQEHGHAVQVVLVLDHRQDLHTTKQNIVWRI